MIPCGSAVACGSGHLFARARAFLHVSACAVVRAHCLLCAVPPCVATVGAGFWCVCRVCWVHHIAWCVADQCVHAMCVRGVWCDVAVAVVVVVVVCVVRSALLLWPMRPLLLLCLER